MCQLAAPRVPARIPLVETEPALHALGFVCAVSVACQRPVDVTGLYVAGVQTAILAPCGDPRVVWSTSDSELRVRYEQAGTGPAQPLFVHVRGFTSDSAGSIYGRLGGAKHRFVVRRVLEIGQRRPNDCVGSVAPLFESVSRTLHLTE